MSYLAHLLERRIKRYGLGGSLIRLLSQFHDLSIYYGYPDKALSSIRRFISVAQRFDVRVTVPIVSLVACRYADLVREIVNMGHEVACHGLIHALYDKMAFNDQLSHFKMAKALLEEVSEVKIVGSRLPYSRFNEGTHMALARAGFKYDSSMRANSKPLPSILKFDGVEILEIPWFAADDVIIDELHFSPSQMLLLWVNKLRLANPGEVFVFDLHPVRMGRYPYVSVLHGLLSFAKDNNIDVLCLEEVYRNRFRLGKAPVLVISGDVDCLRVHDFILRIFKLA